jgi:hypothetical protein
VASFANLFTFKGAASIIPFAVSPVVDITGWSLTFTVTAGFGSTTPLVQKTVGAGVTITSGPNGTYQVVLASADTTAATVGVGFFAYDVWRTDPGAEACLTLGYFVVQPEVRL